MTVLALVAYLGIKGCGLACAAGVVANFEAEVGPGLNPCTVGASGVGLSQWAGARRRRLIATLGPRDWCHPWRQLDFVVAEIAEFGMRDRLFAATDPGEAARYFMFGFERPRSRNPAPRQRRAWEIYRHLTVSPAAPTGKDVTGLGRPGAPSHPEGRGNLAAEPAP